ncbi:MAG: stage II sporulation protein R [Oscillospiraceae bacterium]|nr:stage II sporulation protein R [Oscillospiraceae bacterium]
MKKRIIFFLLVLVLAVVLSAWSDLRTLEDSLIRLHVVGASDSEEDQRVKLLVRDAVVEYLQPVLEGSADRDQAMEKLGWELNHVEELANAVLREQGLQERVTVTLEPEAFPRRDYDTFALPSGVYQSLRIRIGDAEGKNWWCVVFPSLCLSATSEDLRDTAASAGFSDTLTDTVTGEYELRFFLLEVLGRLQNFFREA